MKILGYANENDLIGKSFCQLIRPDSRIETVSGRVKCPFIFELSNGRKVSSEDDLFTHRDGHQIPVEYWGHPTNRDNQLVGGVITFIDITRRKTLEKQL